MSCHHSLRSFRGQLFRSILGGLLVKDLTGVSPQIAWDPTESTAKHSNKRVNLTNLTRKESKCCGLKKSCFALAPPRLEETPQRVNGHRGKSLAPQLTIQRAKPRSRNDEVRSSE